MNEATEAEWVVEELILQRGLYLCFTNDEKRRTGVMQDLGFDVEEGISWLGRKTVQHDRVTVLGRVVGTSHASDQPTLYYIFPQQKSSNERFGKWLHDLRESAVSGEVPKSFIVSLPANDKEFHLADRGSSEIVGISDGYLDVRDNTLTAITRHTRRQTIRLGEPE